MQEEIFGPILPLLPFDTLEEAVSFVQDRPRPLALYLFTKSREVERAILDRIPFGGGCVNDTVVHLSTPICPLAGLGPAVWAATTAAPALRPSPTPRAS